MTSFALFFIRQFGQFSCNRKNFSLMHCWFFEIYIIVFETRYESRMRPASVPSTERSDTVTARSGFKRLTISLTDRDVRASRPATFKG